MVRHLIAMCLVWIGCALEVCAQEQAPEHDPLKHGLDRHGDLWPVRWQVDDSGKLWISPDPASGGATEWGLQIAAGRGSLWSAVEDALQASVPGVVFALCHGNRDLASQADAEYLFRKLGLARDDEAVVQRIVMPPAEEPTAELARIAAIRVAAERMLPLALPGLERLLVDPEAALLLRWAAFDAGAAIRGTPPRVRPPFQPPAGVSNAAAVRGLPPGADLFLRCDHRQLPSLLPARRAIRRASMLRYLDMIRAAGGAVTPPTWAGAQLLADRVVSLPYELAGRFGNARVDVSVVALRFDGGSGGPALWWRMLGHFDDDQLRSGLEAHGGRVDDLDGEWIGHLAGGTTIRWRRDSLEIRRGTWTDSAVASAVPAAVAGEAAIALHLPDLQRIPLLASCVDVGLRELTLQVDIGDDVRIEASGEVGPTSHPTADQLRRLLPWDELRHLDGDVRDELRERTDLRLSDRELEAVLRIAPEEVLQLLDPLAEFVVRLR